MGRNTNAGPPPPASQDQHPQLNMKIQTYIFSELVNFVKLNTPIRSVFLGRSPYLFWQIFGRVQEALAKLMHSLIIRRTTIMKSLQEKRKGKKRKRRQPLVCTP